MVFDITSYGAIPDGITNNSAAIQKAIDECSVNGGRVVIPAGRFLSGSIRLRSNVDLHLESGAELISSVNQDDMIDFSKDFEDDNEDTGWEGGCFIFAAHEQNVSITGYGKIDGQGRMSFYDDDSDSGYGECPLAIKGFRPRMSFLEDIDNLTISDVTFYDAAYWTVHMAGCKNVLIENIRILNNDRAPNNDGIDPDSCKNVIIRGCIIEGGDDSVVLKATGPMSRKYGDCENIVISDCIMKSRSCALKIGTETHGNIHHVILADCILKDCNRGFGIWSRDGGEIHDITIHNIQGNTRRYSNCTTRDTGIHIWWGKGDPVYISATKREGVDRVPGRIYNIGLENLQLISEGMIVIAGEEYSRIQNVSIKNSRIVYKKQSPHDVTFIDEMPSARGCYHHIPGYAYIRCADDVDIDFDKCFEIDESMGEVFITEVFEE